MSALDVVVVAYGSPVLLEQCLQSLNTHSPSDGLEIVVVDNGPGDAAAQLVRARWPETEVVVSGANVGFARAANAGIARGDAPYVLVLNPDVTVHAGTLDGMLAVMDEHPEVGIAGCRLERADGSFDHAARRSFPTPTAAFAHLVGIGYRIGRGRLAQYRALDVERGPVDAVNGAFMVIRRRALESVGTFDPRYWMYMEDLDLCYRFATAGWTTWFEPSVSATHLKGATASRAASARLTAAFYSGMSRFIRTHPEVVQPFWLRPLAYLTVACLGTVGVIRAVFSRFIAPASDFLPKRGR
jgi:N-acetylglucosaminyl-diphospho-decaprenol L-rhamnosyltransferase